MAGTRGPSPKSPPRRYYNITDQGRAALQVLGREWSMLRDGLEEVISRYEQPASSHERASAAS